MPPKPPKGGQRASGERPEGDEFFWYTVRLQYATKPRESPMSAVYEEGEVGISLLLSLLSTLQLNKLA